MPERFPCNDYKSGEEEIVKQNRNKSPCNEYFFGSSSVQMIKANYGIVLAKPEEY